MNSKKKLQKSFSDSIDFLIFINNHWNYIGIMLGIYLNQQYIVADYILMILISLN